MLFYILLLQRNYILKNITSNIYNITAPQTKSNYIKRKTIKYIYKLT